MVTCRRKPWRLALLGATGASILAWHLSIQPTNDGDWLPEVAVLADAAIDGDQVTITNLRDFRWRTAEDFDARYATRTYNLDELQGIDLWVNYWGGHQRIAHTLLSFDFGTGEPLCLTVEVRREHGERWGMLPGIYKQFEVIYVLADERDAIRLRTNVRQETLYLFRTNFSPDESRALLLDVLERVSELNDQPAFYRTIENNCTTALVSHVNAVWPGRIPLVKRVLMNGYVPQIAFESGMIGSDEPFDAFLARSRVDEFARSLATNDDFSTRMRAHAGIAADSDRSDDDVERVGGLDLGG
ncbi:MAG: DUF4105 domain-containing protein, partial [Planctomycetota bacterium]